MDKQCNNLIRILNETGTWTTCSYLAEKMNIPPRRVRYLIKLINNEHNIIQSSSKGYFLKRESNLKKASYSDTIVPANFEERRKYVFEQLVIFNKLLNMEHTAEFFCISFTTFRNEIPVLRKELSHYGLYLKVKGGNLYVIGKDRDKQKFAIDLIKDELGNSYISLTKIQQYFKVVDLANIRKIVLDVFSAREYFLDDYSLLNYVLHLAICIELRNSHVSSISNFQAAFASDIESIVREIACKLNDAYETKLTIDDIMEVSLLTTTRLLSTKSIAIDSKNIAQFVGTEITELIIDIIETVNDTYSIDLNNDRFIVRFAQHIKNLLVRAEKGLSIKNGQFINIKSEYPFLHVIAVCVAYIISKRTHFEISEDEIAYIALHIGVMIEEKTVQEEKLSCIIAVTDYYNIGKSLFEKITQIFSDSLFVLDVVTNYEQLSLEVSGADLIISTYELQNAVIPTIFVGPFFNESDIPGIYSKIEHLKQQKRKNNILSKIEVFLREDLCFFNNNFTTDIDAIETICDYMIAKGYVSSSFKTDIYAHERISPSSYGNIAVAHTLTNHDLNSLIAISINPTSITWGDNRVNIAFIISLNKKDSKLFKDIFKFLTEIVNKKQAFLSILETKSYSELMDVFHFHI